MQKRYCIVDNQIKYIRIYNRKNKIIKKQKQEKYRNVIKNIEQFFKKLFSVAKQIRNIITKILI